jgi:L-threonylcarbamoyladenylate synthase
MLTFLVASHAPHSPLVARAVDVLRDRGVVAYPTDTFYGLAVDPRSPEATSRLFRVKRRSASTAIPLIAASIEQAQRVATFSPADLRLAQRFWPGPLTLVMPARPGVADAILAGGKTVAVRVPAHPIARALASEFGFCITATSANASGEPPATSAYDVVSAVGERIDLLLDAGRTEGDAPSTVVEMTGDGPRLIRAGVVPWDRVLESLE